MTPLDASAAAFDHQSPPRRTFLCALRAERLKSSAGLVWGMIIATVIGSALLGYVFPGMVPIHSQDLPGDMGLNNGASGLPLSVDEFARPDGAWAIQRFLSPHVGLIALFLAVAMTSRDVRSRVLLMQLTYGPSRLTLTSATWLVALGRWGALSALALVVGALAAGAAVLTRGLSVDGWFHTDVLTSGLRTWVALMIIGGFYSALGQAGAYLLRSSVLSLALPIIYFLMIEPALTMMPIKSWMLPGSYVKQIGWAGSDTVTGLPGATAVIIVLVTTSLLIAAAPALLRRRSLS